MPIITSLAAAVLASAFTGAAAPATSSLPPVTITVSAEAAVPPTLVKRVLDETDAVWRAAGFSFVWRRETDAARARIDAGPCLAPGLRVTIGSGRAADAERRHDNRMALGWIVFDDGRPDSEIYISYDNAEAYMISSRGAVGLVDRMPILEREFLLARVMGRALAHEIGHFLLASKVHTPRGLMMATHTASEFFGYERTAFAIDAAQRQAVAARLRKSPVVAALHDVR
jgi:hypothetical protein